MMRGLVLGVRSAKNERAMAGRSSVRSSGLLPLDYYTAESLASETAGFPFLLAEVTTVSLGIPSSIKGSFSW